jgi:pimeloyl-ACP methyl ester carboxylesterase
MTFDSRRRLPEIKSPTHVVAANDAAVPIHHAKMLRAGINASQLLVIDDADHALNLGTRGRVLVCPDGRRILAIRSDTLASNNGLGSSSTKS